MDGYISHAAINDKTADNENIVESVFRSSAHRGAPDWTEGVGGEAGEDRRLGAARRHLR